jgi:DNA-binding NarL/FixJ family response regulator
LWLSGKETKRIKANDNKNLQGSKPMAATKPPIRVISIDDHALVHEAIRSLIEGRDDIILIGSETNGARGLKAVTEMSPDVVIVDISLADMNGLALAQRIVREMPLTNIVILSMHEERVYVQKALETGAKAYVSKRSHGDHVLQAIRAAAEGGVYIDPAIAGRLLASRGTTAAFAGEGPGAGRAALTEREADVVRMVALGYTAKEIAGHLGITAKSVETYKARACEKLEMKTRTQLVRFAAAQGWLTQS